MSTISATSVSDCPTPIVSIKQTSNPAAFKRDKKVFHGIIAEDDIKEVHDL